MSAPSNPASHPDETISDGRDELVGLIPAAGFARRLGPLPCSKELLPIAVREPGDAAAADGPADPGAPRIQVVAERLLSAFGRAGVERALMVIDQEKVDIPRYFADRAHRPARRDGADGPRALAFVPVHRSPSVPHSLAAALPFLGGSPVALGFPDVLFTPGDAFVRIERHRLRSGAALVLGLFPASDPTTTDMVEVAGDGRVVRIETRPRRSSLALNWLIAVWDRRFTAWLAGRMAGTASAEATGEPNAETAVHHGAGELQLGALFAEALTDGLSIEGVSFPDGAYLDVGTPEGYSRALGAADPLWSSPPR